jgi:hypothetical protein
MIMCIEHIHEYKMSVAEFNNNLLELANFLAEKFPNVFSADAILIEGLISNSPNLPYNVLGERLYTQRKKIVSVFNSETNSYNWSLVEQTKLDDHLNPGEKSARVVQVYNDSITSFRALNEADKITVLRIVTRMLGDISKIKKASKE